jgi:hypothetical protein
MTKIHKQVRVVTDPLYSGVTLCDKKIRWLGILTWDNTKVTCKKCLKELAGGGR